MDADRRRYQSSATSEVFVVNHAAIWYVNIPSDINSAAFEGVHASAIGGVLRDSAHGDSGLGHCSTEDLHEKSIVGIREIDLHGTGVSIEGQLRWRNVNIAGTILETIQGGIVGGS
jgi:hypothetical protein